MILGGFRSLQQRLCCFLLEAEDEAKEREGVAQWWGGELAGSLPLHTDGR